MKRPALVNYDTFPYDWVTPPELAAYVQCDPRTIVRMIAMGSVVAFRVGRNWRIPLKEARRMFPVERAS